MAAKDKVEGGCLCGEIRYESSAPPLAAGYCHCSVCRKAHGHLYAALVQFNRDKFDVSKGKLSHYQGSNLAKRSFCGSCGSSLIFSYDDQPTLFVLAGTLDSPDDCQYDAKNSWGHAFVSDKVSWLEINDGLPQHKQSAGFLTEATIARNE